MLIMLFKYSLCDKRQPGTKISCMHLIVNTHKRKNAYFLKRVKLQKRLITKFENWPDSNTSQALLLRDKRWKI